MIRLPFAGCSQCLLRCGSVTGRGLSLTSSGDGIVDAATDWEASTDS